MYAGGGAKGEDSLLKMSSVHSYFVCVSVKNILVNIKTAETAVCWNRSLILDISGLFWKSEPF